MLLADFKDPAEPARWRPTDDVVMGGRSASAMLPGEGVGVFQGVVSLAEGGGFASVRRADAAVDLSGWEALALRVRGDGQRYKLNLRTSTRPDGLVYQAAFVTEPGAWVTAVLPLSAFAPRFRGRPAAGALELARVCSLGLLISDAQAGPFRLELASIAAQ